MSVCFASRFQGFIQRAYDKTGQRVVILVDEYILLAYETIPIRIRYKEMQNCPLAAWKERLREVWK